MSADSLRYDTDIKQRRASDPKASAFVAANAGSGKTHVLVKRLLRLLVDGVDPGKILALTYTTAAAANMSTRVFRDLSRWVTLDDDALGKELFDLDQQTPSITKIKEARRLFARAVETPGGLKIQTIHAFCERVLHLFPFEANVPAGFDILDEKAVEDRLQHARESVISTAGRSDPVLREALALVIETTGETGFNKVIDPLVKERTALRELLREKHGKTASDYRIKRALGLRIEDTSESVSRALYDGRLSDEQLRAMMAVLSRSDAKTDQKTIAAFSSAMQLPSSDEWEDVYFNVFLTAENTPRAAKGLTTVAIDGIDPNIRITLLKEQQRIVDLLEKRKATDCAERSCAALRVAGAILTHYEQEKIKAGSLDFDDLIERTNALFTRAGARWVLYKLDQGIDHLLIDEAQDTSPAQWDILHALTEEFHAGETARTVRRTVFAVGDPKQSIYSFQGAEPESFFLSRSLFQKRVDEEGRSSFHAEDLTLSFRSSPVILDAVDAVFSAPHRYRGLEKDPRPTSHASQRSNAPGLVELWPLIAEEKKDPPQNWIAPLDEPGAGSPSVRLAMQIADHIKTLIDPSSKEMIHDETGQPRAIRPGDILILVRNRNIFFETVIRALKDRGLPVAGADRLKLQDHIAAMDLAVLGYAMLTRDDDLSLATLLKTPLIGLDDDALMKFAPERNGSLADALDAVNDHETLMIARDKVKALRDAAAHLSPFEFFAFVLGPFGGRRAFRARLGTEAEDALDEFLRLALDFEQKSMPSLRAFLAEFSATSREIKRDMDMVRDEIRVMTVHGAKGLEAPVVYLPDTSAPAVRAQRIGPIFDLGRESGQKLLIWSPTKQDDPEIVSAAREEASAREADEHRRLLYVALTRARDRLYIAGTTTTRARGEGNWYDMIAEGLADRLQPIEGVYWPEGAQRYAHGELTMSDHKTAPIVREATSLPQWLFAKAAPEKAPLPPLKPSNAFDAADRPDRPNDRALHYAARRRGTLIHALIEHLPALAPDERAAAGQRWLLAKAPDLDDTTRATLLTDALALMALPALAPLFGPKARAECPVAGTVTLPNGETRAVSGQIDRLFMDQGRVILADFKTSALPPKSVDDVPEKIVLQMALYAELMRKAAPGASISCLVIYTASKKVFEVERAALAKALGRIASGPSLDGDSPHS